jgi:homoserine/homoserine lactone efflux protein
VPINTHLYLAFVGATALLIAMPGPTAMLVTSTSIRRGTRAGLTAVAGSSTAVIAHLTIVVAGLASVIALVGEWFEWIRWIGAGYLIFLGLRSWFTKASRESKTMRNASSAGDFGRGFLVTLTNPKTLFFLGAFLPQFVDPELPALQQLLTLALTFLVVSAVLDSGWALLAATVGTSLKSPRLERLRDRITGTILIAAGTALALARRQ